MTALDRALIKAYRASGRAHASAYAEAAQATLDHPRQYAQHGSEPVLAGPHWHRRPNVLSSGGAQVQAAGLPPTPVAFAPTSPSVTPVPTAPNMNQAAGSPLDASFRMDVGMAGVPTTPNWPTAPVAVSVTAPSAPAASAGPVFQQLSRSVPLSQAAIIHQSPTIPTDETKPQWVVDEFIWPSMVEDLAYHAANQMDRWLWGLTSAAHDQAAKSVAVAGTEPGVGTSTTLLALALRAIAAGLRPAIIDANSVNPTLAHQLSILAESGWEAVVAGHIPLGRALVESIRDRAVLLPLITAVPWSALSNASLRHTLPWQILAAEYDVLLFDAGSVEHEHDAAHLRTLCDLANLTGVFAVCDARYTIPDELITFARRLKLAGVRVLGTIENFANTTSLGHDVA